MQVAHILKAKGTAVHSVPPETTIGDVVHSLSRKRVGAVLVLANDGRIAGIISERDIVHGLAARGGAFLAAEVAAAMTRRVVTCSPQDNVADLMALVTNRRFRHLPVVEDGRLCGIVSIGDLVKSRLDEIEHEARSLRSFISGP